MGAKVALCARDEQKLQSAAAEIERKRRQEPARCARMYRAAADVSSLFATMEQALGPIEILVNNAGIGYFGPSARSLGRKLGCGVRHQFESGVPAEQSGGARNDSSSARPHHQYCVARRQERICGWWNLLRFKMGSAWVDAVHGGGFARRTEFASAPFVPEASTRNFRPHAGKDLQKMLQPEDVAHAVETIVTQEPQSFISEVLLRPTQKP